METAIVSAVATSVSRYRAMSRFQPACNAAAPSASASAVTAMVAFGQALPAVAPA